MKTVVLVLGTYHRPYTALIRTIRETWAASQVSGVETIFYYGGHTLVRTDDELVVPTPDDSAHIGLKTLAAFEYVLEYVEADLVFRTNCSSYLDLPNLVEYALANARPSAFYGGVIGWRGDIPFASGSGYFISPDLMELALTHRDRWDHKCADDAALAMVLSEHGIRPRPAPRQDFERVADVAAIDTSLYHFRCRTTSWRRLEDRRIMKRVHRAFQRARAEGAAMRGDAA